MARRKHRRSGFGSLVSFPSVGGIKEYSPLGKSVNSTDVLVGAAIGMAGGTLVQKGIQKLDAMLGGKIPDFITGQYAGPISSILAGVLAYSFQRKSHKSRGTGHLIGATLIGLAPIGWTALAKTGLAGYVDVNYGLLTSDPGMNGMLIADQGMAGLAAFSESDEEDILDAA